MNKLLLCCLTVCIISCRKSAAEKSLKGDWDITFNQVVALVGSGDSIITSYPKDEIADWIFTSKEVEITSSKKKIPFWVDKNALLFQITPTYVRNYQIIELTNQTLKLRKADDPYFPNLEIHFVKL